MSHILIIDDNDTMREGMALIVRKMGHNVFTASSGIIGLEIYGNETIDFVLTDLKMEGLDGIDVLKKIREENPHALVMIITAYGTIEKAVEAMKLGAFDFITKPFSPEELKMKVSRALDVVRINTENTRLSEENLYFREFERERYDFDEIIGKSEPMQRVFQTIEKIAKTDSSVIIYGESGTGKELVARAIHFNSLRRGGSFIKVNCGALAEGILESELFGHEKGAFSGASNRRMGRFELAHKGTIFLDEIGDISKNIQLKLLRVLQEREFERVGGCKTLSVDVRVICATNKNLQELVEKDSFREDLYYRLHIVPIHLPPLRERKEDVRDLVQHFMKKLQKRTRKEIRGIEPKALDLLMNHHWPGNVRELENVLEQMIVFTDHDIIEASDIPSFLGARRRDENSLTIPDGNIELDGVLEDLERQLIEKAFKKANGVKTETAKLLGIKTSALYYKLEKYGLV